ncbi:hypothetical protein D5S18_03135 [Nocardia panacis]|uniref:Uncharacterized protein n=2 Tax=Nocardia panacis TaxID=2340916 RepID=A0A3A4KIA0_9NOCA|nr:hypothetical protein D5S18_03135 [Nocardia panacis]
MHPTSSDPILVRAAGVWLCRQCRERLETLIATTPHVIDWVRANVIRGTAVRREGSNPNRTGSVAPCDLDAIDQADNEVAVLARWCAHAGLRTLPGPVHRDYYGVARAIAQGDTATVHHAARWLLDNLTALERQAWVVDMLADLDTVRGETLRRFPLRELVEHESAEPVQTALFG